MILLFTLAGVVSGSRQGVINFTKIAFPVRLLGVSVLLILVLIALIPLNKLRYYKSWQNTFYTYNTGNYSLANSEYQNLLPALKYEGLLLQQYGKSLQMAGRNYDAVKVMNEAKLLTSDDVLYTTLGDAYKGMKEYGKAEEAYTFAAYMVPNKLYPHYLLAKLYEASGQRGNAVAKAKEVLGMNPKVESMAVKEIMAEMKKLLGRE
jgi:tetratricopeptide (TPR) repeat protein